MMPCGVCDLGVEPLTWVFEASPLCIADLGDGCDAFGFSLAGFETGFPFRVSEDPAEELVFLASVMVEVGKLGFELCESPPDFAGLGFELIEEVANFAEADFGA